MKVRRDIETALLNKVPWYLDGFTHSPILCCHGRCALQGRPVTFVIMPTYLGRCASLLWSDSYPQDFANSRRDSCCH